MRPFQIQYEINMKICFGPKESDTNPQHFYKLFQSVCPPANSSGRVRKQIETKF